MRIGLILVCCFSLSLLAQGQERFWEFVPGWRNNQAFEFQDSYYLLGLQSIPQGSGLHTFQYNLIGSSGLLLSEFNYSVDSVEVSSTFGNSQLAVEIDNTYRVATLIGNPSEPIFYGALFEFDPVTESMDLLHTYDDDTWSQLRAIEIKNDSSLILAGIASEDGPVRRIIVYETNLNGEPRWNFTSTCGPFCNSDIQQILPLGNGHTAILFEEHDLDQPAFSDREKAVIVVLDELGEEVWRDEPGPHEDFRIWPGGILEHDGEIILSYSNPYYYDENEVWQLNYESSIYFQTYDLVGTPLQSFDLVGQIPNGNSPGVSRFHS